MLRIHFERVLAMSGLILSAVVIVGIALGRG